MVNKDLSNNPREQSFKSLMDLKNVKLSPVGQRWFMISNKWLYLWKCFVLNRLCTASAEDDDDWSDYVDQSENPAIGILPPGMISNEEDLMVTEEKKLLEGLRINLHYRALPECVWKIFKANYGGGPEIIRESMDIYSREVVNGRLVAKQQSKTGQGLGSTPNPKHDAFGQQIGLMVEKIEKGKGIKVEESSMDNSSLTIMEQVLVEEEFLPRFSCLAE